MKRYSCLAFTLIVTVLTTLLPAPFSTVEAHSTPGAPKPEAAGAPKKPMHHHKTKAIPAGQPVPTVKLVVQPDAMKGWNLQVQVTNFRFAPERVNQSSDVRESHAHLYINGQKVARLYSSWYYLENLKPGRYQVTVTLNTNKHEDLTDQGNVISDTVTVEVPENR